MFAAWVMFAIVGLPIRKQLGLSDAQFTLLAALPVLTGSLLRLPAGLLADRFGGKKLFVVNTLLTALFSLALCFAHSYTALLSLALGVGLAGVSFAVGNSWIAQWVPWSAGASHWAPSGPETRRKPDQVVGSTADRGAARFYSLYRRLAVRAVLDRAAADRLRRRDSGQRSRRQASDGPADADRLAARPFSSRRCGASASTTWSFSGPTSP